MILVKTAGYHLADALQNGPWVHGWYLCLEGLQTADTRGTFPQGVNVTLEHKQYQCDKGQEKDTLSPSCGAQCDLRVVRSPGKGWWSSLGAVVRVQNPLKWQGPDCLVCSIRETRSGISEITLGEPEERVRCGSHSAEYPLAIAARDEWWCNLSFTD